MVEQVLEIVKRYEITVEGLGYKVFAKITKEYGKERYEWSVSHYYIPNAGMGIYMPSATVFNTFEECEHRLFYYVDKFTAKYGIQEDPTFIK